MRTPYERAADQRSDRGVAPARLPRPAATADGEPDSEDLAARLRASIQHLMPMLRAQSVHSDLTPSRLSALAALDDRGPLRISELSARMGIALSTASRMIDLLEGLGWVHRRADPADLRASLVDVTPQGRTVLRSVRTEHAGKLATEIARLPADRIRLLHDALPALEALADQVQQGPAAGRTDNPGAPDGG
ncbi:MarR family winged helix-turn-helix transcriptional regulator [Streptomyces sp. NPDC050560]|uniref:MarR family winged helix-turn-helix transcriptional regulator n=1 Tax=Streptomyces sp. NPDC050560 TaxID=3365630 RepID=UPI0037AF177F